MARRTCLCVRVRFHFISSNFIHFCGDEGERERVWDEAAGENERNCCRMVKSLLHNDTLSPKWRLNHVGACIKQL